MKRSAINHLRSGVATVSTIGSVFLSGTALASEPYLEREDMSANYVGCMLAVNDATRPFRDALQATCFHRMGDLCSGPNGGSALSQLLPCLAKEHARSLRFLEAGFAALPEAVEKKGPFTYQYERRRKNLAEMIKTSQDTPQPETMEDAFLQIGSTAAAVTMLFWFARETDTNLDEVLDLVSDP